MLVYLFIGALLALLVAQRWDHGNQLKAERTHSSTLLANVRELTDQIVLLKVEPQSAAAYASPDPVDELPSMLGDDSPAADAAWAEIVERNRA